MNKKKIIVKGKKQNEENKMVKTKKEINIIKDKSPQIKIIKNENIKIETCIHISDLHIRLNSINSDKYDELNAIFNELFKQIEEQKQKTTNLIIVISGDICDKSRL